MEQAVNKRITSRVTMHNMGAPWWTHEVLVLLSENLTVQLLVNTLPRAFKGEAGYLGRYLGERKKH